MQLKRILLKPIIKEHSQLFEDIENRIIRVFQREVFMPLLHTLSYQMRTPRQKISNSPQILKEALDSGRISYYRGAFRGKFNSVLTKELKSMGAVWHSKTASFRLKMQDIPFVLQIVISNSRYGFSEKLAVLDKMLSEVNTDTIAEKVHVQKPFEATIDKVEETFQESIQDIPKSSVLLPSKGIPPTPRPMPTPNYLKSKTDIPKNPYDAVMEKVLKYEPTPQGITVSPQLTKEQRAEVTSEYQENIRRNIKGLSEEQIKSLRKRVEASARAGNRYDALIKGIETEYGITTSRARFIARQETNLFLAAFKKARYTSAGSETYIWGCVKRPHDTSPDHHTLGNVRFYHGILEGKVQRWDNPPPTDAKGNKNNPLEDFGCRCFAIPQIEF